MNAHRARCAGARPPARRPSRARKAAARDRLQASDGVNLLIFHGFFLSPRKPARTCESGATSQNASEFSRRGAPRCGGPFERRLREAPVGPLLLPRNGVRAGVDAGNVDNVDTAQSSCFAESKPSPLGYADDDVGSPSIAAVRDGGASHVSAHATTPARARPFRGAGESLRARREQDAHATDATPAQSGNEADATHAKLASDRRVAATPRAAPRQRCSDSQNGRCVPTIPPVNDNVRPHVADGSLRIVKLGLTERITRGDPPTTARTKRAGMFCSAAHPPIVRPFETQDASPCDFSGCATRKPAPRAAPSAPTASASSP
jgi:hypothetical protein